jgi:hypothetical protein
MIVACAVAHKRTSKFDKFNTVKSVPKVSWQTLVGTDLKMKWVQHILQLINAATENLCMNAKMAFFLWPFGTAIKFPVQPNLIFHVNSYKKGGGGGGGGK